MNPGSVRVGPITAGVVVLLAVLAVASLWVARHPANFRRLPFIHVLVGFLPARLDAMLLRLRARLGISTVAMALAAAGLLLVGVLAVGFTALLDDVLEGEGIVRFDDPIAGWLAGHRELWLTKLLLALTRLGNADIQTIWLALVCLVATVRSRSWAPILVGLAGGGGIALVIVVAKKSVGRRRPPLPYAVMSEDGFSFPSGHATGAAAVGLLSAWILCRWVVRQWPAQVAAHATVIGVVGLIGFSRCYLGVHYVADVLAGWLLGAAWAGAVLLLASWWLRAASLPPPVRPLPA